MMMLNAPMKFVPSLRQLSEFLYLLGFGMSTLSAQAQVIPDGTLSSTVNSPDNQNFVIEAGARAGNNLFHSFDEFSVPTNGSAIFNNAVDIENIFSRVTGSSVSDIDGLVQANGTANLFLLNPNGIFFGENASLNIGGSFVGSTAERVHFSDSVEFSASDAALAPLLTVSTPVGLGLGANPGSITITGPGHSLPIDFSSSASIRENRPVGLQVKTGKTLALIGGDILVEGGNLTANQGRVELGSVAQADRVSLIPTTDGLTVDYATTERFGDLTFTQAASVDVSGEGSGNLHFQAGNLAVIESSAIISNVLGAEQGGDVRIRASESVEIRGSQTEEFSSGFFNQGGLGSTGNVGNLLLETERLEITNNGSISNNISGAGHGGNLTIVANEIDINNDSPFLTTGLFTQVSSNGTGRGGNLVIDAGTLRTFGGIQINGSTFDQGNGGTIDIQADIIELTGIHPSESSFSGIVSASSAIGNAGNIRLRVNQLLITEGSRIFGGTFGQGNGSTIDIQAGTIELVGSTPSGRAPSSIVAGSGSVGNAGSINLNVDTLRITEGAQLSNSAFGQGNGGPINIQANTIDLIGVDSSGRFASGIFAAVGLAGNAGDISLEVDTLRLIGGAQLGNGTFSQGDGGSIIIRANNVEIIGMAPSNEFSSGIFASSEAGSEGNAGNIDLQIQNRLRILAGAQLTTSTVGTGDAGDILIQANEIEVLGVSEIGRSNSRISAVSNTGLAASDAGSVNIVVETLRVEDRGLINVSSLGRGDASDLTIMADQIFVRDGGKLLANVAAGNQGNIILSADSLLFMRQEALISTNATNDATGGNIIIDAPIILGLGNSDIVANAMQGDGGNIEITTQALLGLEFRDFQTPENDITASSEFGLDGVVQINTPDLVQTQDIVELPSNLTDPSNQISTGCLVATDNSFTVSGRSGLPDLPDSPNSSAVWEDWRPLETEAGVAIPSTPVEPATLIEATDAVIATNGQVEFVAKAGTGMSPNQMGCGGRR